ncbi:MAG: galactokinase family protein, partial [Solirubrobacterales bacterium]|nr:galactokinase family protein [Solirubrobacterales bacterium]
MNRRLMFAVDMIPQFTGIGGTLENLREHVIAFAPGRVNLIGEHTDYNQGLALPFAIDDGVTVDGRAIDANRIDAVAV